MPRKKDVTESMIDIFSDFQDNKKIGRTTLVGVLEESFRSVLAKMFGSDENFDVIVNPDKGDLEIYRNRIVVGNDDVNDPNKEISLSDAHKIDSDYEIGEEVSEPINFAKFGRRAILTLRQTLASKVLELEHDSLYTISALKAERDYDEVIFVTPDGEKFDQRMANTLSLSENLIILCGHYKGIDYRIREHFITKEITIGDYVLTGGELPAAIITDAIVRLIPGAIGDEQSALSDSFQDNLLAPPVYTRPAEYKGWRVPDVLLSGHQARIDDWKHEMALKRTRELRPDLLDE